MEPSGPVEPSKFKTAGDRQIDLSLEEAIDLKRLLSSLSTSKSSLFYPLWRAKHLE
jgi:hypothetical protein